MTAAAYHASLREPTDRALMDSSPGQAGRLGWYARRLSSMTPGEMVWRGRRLAEGRVPRRDLSLRSTVRLLRSEDDWDAVSYTHLTLPTTPYV